MNKNVLNKLSKIESKVELAEVKVDLAVIEDIKKLQISANKIEENALNELKKAISILDNASKLYDTANKSAILVINEINKARGMSKELGIELPANIESIANYYGQAVGDWSAYARQINSFSQSIFK